MFAIIYGITKKDIQVFFSNCIISKLLIRHFYLQSLKVLRGVYGNTIFCSLWILITHIRFHTFYMIRIIYINAYWKIYICMHSYSIILHNIKDLIFCWKHKKKCYFKSGDFQIYFSKPYSYSSSRSWKCLQWINL